MIDFHSHVLPGIDDGSESPRESEQMLRTSFAQGVELMVASPHFYPSSQELARWLEKRKAAREQISYDEKTMPKLLLGAELAYFDGMSNSVEIEKLCVEGTRLLLVEMPFYNWTRRMLEDVCALPSRQNIRPVLAHVERYYPFVPHRSTLEELSRQGVLLQCNGQIFLDRFHGRSALNLLKKGHISFLGSDAHGISFRPPNLAQAAELICKKLGDETLKELTRRGYRLLNMEQT